MFTLPPNDSRCCLTNSSEAPFRWSNWLFHLKETHSWRNDNNDNAEDLVNGDDDNLGSGWNPKKYPPLTFFPSTTFPWALKIRQTCNQRSIIYKTQKLTWRINWMSQSAIIITSPRSHRRMWLRAWSSWKIAHDGDDDDGDGGGDGDGDLDVDNLHGRHMLLHQPLLHIFPGEAAVMPHSLENVIHLPTHLCDKCCRCKVTFKNHKTCSDCGNRIKSKSESEKTHEMQIRTAYDAVSGWV